MIRQFLCACVAVAAITMVVGCDKAASDAKDKSKDAVKDVKDAAKDAVKDVKDAGKDAVKDVKDAAKGGLGDLTEATKDLPKIEEKINALSAGDVKTKATAALGDLKKLIDEAKAAVTNPEKWKTTFEAVKTKLAELKKLVGL